MSPVCGLWQTSPWRAASARTIGFSSSARDQAIVITTASAVVDSPDVHGEVRGSAAASRPGKRAVSSRWNAATSGRAGAEVPSASQSAR